MHRLGICIVSTVLLIFLSVFCSASFGEEQDQALIEAARKGDSKQVQDFLDKGADVNRPFRQAKGILGWTPLIEASFKGHLEIAKLLLDRGADVNAKGIGGETALMAATKAGHKEIVELLKAHGAKE